MEENVQSEISGLSNELRFNRRIKFKEQQEFNRMRAFDSNRFVESEILTDKDVAGLCSRIKRRKHATEEDLRKLSNAFIQSEENIKAFIKTTGAINILIKEFTGGERSQQLLAAQCLCNLCLGDETCCSKVALFAGSYLMIFIMKSSDVTFSRICLWVTQNIVAAGTKAMKILLSQELLRNCLHIATNSVDLETEALQLLDIIIETNWMELDEHERQEVQLSMWNLLKKRSDDTLVLQVFCRSEALERLCSGETEQLLLMMIKNLESVNTETAADEHAFYFSLKILIKALKLEEQNSAKIIELLFQHKLPLSVLINGAAKNPKFFSSLKDLMFLFSALHDFNPNSSNAQFSYSTFDPIDKIKIPKIFEF